jgi:protocatechuate 3,4-dioxygenase beta subunit
MNDTTVGRLLTRREAVALLGFAVPAASTAHLLAQNPSPQRPAAGILPCVVQPEQTEGPYFVDRMLNRSDIRTDPKSGAAKVGLPLWITFQVSRLGGDRTCTPLAGAHVDVWQCDAKGIYSGVEDPGFNTVGEQFLRGYQITDADGRASFRTIYPGWYRGRAVHVHFKVRTDPSSDRGQEFTSQLYFDEATNDRVLSGEPYSVGSNRTRNEADRIFRNEGGAQLIIPLKARDDGYAGEFSLAIKSA